MKARDLHLILISASALLIAAACRLIAMLVHRGNWKSSRSLPVVRDLVYRRFWNDLVQRLSGFHSNVYLVWATLGGWVWAAAAVTAWGTGITKEEFLWTAAPDGAKFISLALAQPKGPKRRERLTSTVVVISAGAQRRLAEYKPASAPRHFSEEFSVMGKRAPVLPQPLELLGSARLS